MTGHLPATGEAIRAAGSVSLSSEHDQTLAPTESVPLMIKYSSMRIVWATRAGEEGEQLCRDFTGCFFG